MIFLDRFNEIIKANQYKLAHEELESTWKQYKQAGNVSEALLLKGLINGATALELKRLKRYEASQKAWNTLLKYSYQIEFIEKTKISKYTAALNILREKMEES